MFDLEDDNALRRLCYFAAFLMMLLPMFGALGASWPLGFGNVRWRMAASNNFAQAMQLPFLGLVLTLVIARVVNDKTIARVVGIVSALVAAVMVIAIGLFTLDSLQLKSIVRTGDMPAYNLALIRVAFLLIVFLVAFSVLAFVALKSQNGQEKLPAKGSKRASAEEPVGFLIGQDMSK